MRGFYIFFLVLLALSSVINTANAITVSVPDDVLESKLRGILGLGPGAPIDSVALIGLSGELDLSTTENAANKIEDLEGLQYLIGIAGLLLDNHDFGGIVGSPGLEPIRNLQNLTGLSMNNCGVITLRSLQLMVDLQSLSADKNNIVNVEILGSLTALTALSLKENKIADIASLANLENLTTVYLEDNDAITDFSPLAWLPVRSTDIIIPPAVRINDILTDEQNGAFDVMIEFSEVVTGFDDTENDILLTGSANATVTRLTGSNKEYTATITPENDGKVVIQVPAGVAQGGDSEDNVASLEYTVSVDVAPRVTEIRWPADFGEDLEYHTSPTDIFEVSVDIIFSEDVPLSSDTQSQSVQLLGTATTAGIKSVNEGDSDSEYTLTILITPTTDGTGDGTLGIRIPEGFVQDGGGNDNIEYSTGADAATILFAPTLEIVVPNGSQNGSFDVMFKFNEPVTGFTQQWVDDYFDSNSVMIAIGGTLTDWAGNAAGTIYTATITPTRDGVFPVFQFEAQGIPAVNSHGIQVLDLVSSPGTVQVNLPGPTVTITGDLPEIVNGSFEVTITFSEEVTGFDDKENDILLTGAAAATVTSISGNGSKYTATIEPKSDGEVIIQVPIGAVISTPTGSNTASNSYTVQVNLPGPTVTITGDLPEIVNGPFEVTITFSEEVIGFTIEDIELTDDAGVTDFNGSGREYIAEITPDAGSDGEVTIQVPEGAAISTATGDNTPSNIYTVQVDLARPSVTITGDLEIVNLENPSFEVTITFNEEVTGFAIEDIDLTGDAGVTDFNDSGREYIAEITPDAGSDGEVSIQVPEGAGIDAAMNSNTESNRYTVEVDLVAPTVEITGPNTADAPFDVTITFSEEVTGFTAGDIDLTEGDAAATVTRFNGSGRDYTATITGPSGEIGAVIIQVPADAVEDAAGNPNTASESHTVQVDFTRPYVTITTEEDLPEIVNGSFEVTITFSKEVTGFTIEDIVLTDIEVTGAAATVTSFAGSGRDYTATITPEPGSDGPVSIQVPANVAFDLDIEDNPNTESSHTVLVDLVAPTVEITGVPTQVTMDTFEVAVTFSEDVEGFDVGDILLSANDASTTWDEGPRAVYTVTITLASEIAEALIVQVPAEVATDAAGNFNTASIEYRIEAWMPDPNLRDIVRDALGLPVAEIFTTEALLDLRVLDTTEIFLFSDDAKITDLTGLEYATELTELSLNEHAISDLRPLATLTQLTKLSLNDNLIESIWHEDSDDNPFENLTELTELSLDNNLIDDLSPLESLPQLTKLSLNGNVIEDISALEALAALTGLSLNLNLIDDITALEALTQLTTLSLNENPIDDLTPLQGLTELTELSLNDNSIDDLFFCEALTQLKILCLEDNKISDVSPLVDLPNLELLKLSGNPIHDPASLIGIARRIEADALIASLVPDEALAEILRDIFDLDRAEYVTFADMRSLTTFEAPDSDITDLSGLEHATNLNTLDLRGNTIADITPLKALTKLTTLDLGVNSISTIDALAGLTGLVELSLEENGITDVTPLAGLVKLETLRLTGNPIQNANSLSNLTAHIEADIVVPGVIIDPALAVAIQETLDLPANTRILAETLEDLVSLNAQVGEVDTLAGLEHATHLTTLRIDAGSITDVTPLQALAALTTLEINSDALTVITPLQTLTQLTTLKLNGGAITDVTPLQTLIALTILELRDNTITDIAPLAVLTALTTLDLSGNSISSIEVLQVLTGLTTLDVSGNSISSIEAVQVLTGLTTLDVSGNSLSSIEVLQVLTGLTTLDVSGNSINSIEAVQALPGLTTLDVSGNSINSIEAVQVLTGLTTLAFADNSLSSIDGLQALPGLTRLNLSANDLSDIQPLQGLTELKQLYLASNNINDVLSLAGLVNLEFLRLAGNRIMDTSPLFGLVTTYKLMDVDIEISQWAPWDVNQDGVVNAMDATLVTAAIGQTAEMIANPLTDVNGDGVVNRNDLLLVQEHLNTDAAGAPSTDTIVALLGLDTLKSLSRTSLETELNALMAETDGSIKYQRAIQFLESFLLALRPDKTRLLANYPNPFNPETWIPYHLADASNVHITIYDTRGIVVRRLDLGHQREGYYTSKSRAAYWDGRNHIGERVASGIYFYELEANDISRLRKMVILK